MPNFSRAYRKGYTDGIHHGWDIFAPNETPVQALDHGIIVRTVRGFQFEDL
jgi:murein DD-endopeptidase MepM/ murein hydrolase activator NlpD